MLTSQKYSHFLFIYLFIHLFICFLSFFSFFSFLFFSFFFAFLHHAYPVLPIMQSAPLNCFLECGKTLTDHHGSIRSPNFPGVYGANQHCEWTVQAPSQTLKHVELTFASFDISGKMPDCTSGDYLEIFLGCKFHSIGRYCASILPPAVYSPDHCMRLVFHSDGADNTNGFEATYDLRSVVTGIVVICEIFLPNSFEGLASPPLFLFLVSVLNRRITCL